MVDLHSLNISCTERIRELGSATLVITQDFLVQEAQVSIDHGFVGQRWVSLMSSFPGTQPEMIPEY